MEMLGKIVVDEQTGYYILQRLFYSFASLSTLNTDVLTPSKSKKSPVASPLVNRHSTWVIALLSGGEATNKSDALLHCHGTISDVIHD